jgi:hypothetical protein
MWLTTTGIGGTKMAFPLEKILTVDADTYCRSVKKDISDYELRGVNVANEFEDEDLTSLHDAFAESVPESAEVVVEYRFTTALGDKYVDSYASGTALIPRDNSNQIRDGNNLNGGN